jgi:hypothetical protein
MCRDLISELTFDGSRRTLFRVSCATAHFSALHRRPKASCVIAITSRTQRPCQFPAPRWYRMSGQAERARIGEFRCTRLVVRSSHRFDPGWRRRLGWVATSTHARVEPRPSAAGSALEHQLHCAPPMLPLGTGVWQDQHMMNCWASATVANVGPGGWRIK